MLFYLRLGLPIWVRLSMLAAVLVILAFDLGLLHRESHETGVRESLKMSAFYVSLDPLLSVAAWSVYYTHAVSEAIEPQIAAQPTAAGKDWAAGDRYLTSYLVVRSGDDHPLDLSNNAALTFLRRHLRLTGRLHGERCLVKLPDPKGSGMLWFGTPLLLCLVLVELADIVFAIDSVPAIFAITPDPFIVYSANISANLGLRAALRAGSDGALLPFAEVRPGPGAACCRRENLLG